MEEFPYYAVWFREGTFEEGDAERGGEWEGREGMGECAACDAGADDEDVILGFGHGGWEEGGGAAASWRLVYRKEHDFLMQGRFLTDRVV